MPESNHKLQRNCIAGQDAFLSELASSLVQLRELTRPVLWSLIISALLQDFLCGECVCVCVCKRERERERERERDLFFYGFERGTTMTKKDTQGTQDGEGICHGGIQSPCS